MVRSMNLCNSVTSFYLYSKITYVHPISFSVLSIDAMDISGEQQLDVATNLYKRRLNPDGSKITEEDEKQELGKDSKNAEEIIKVNVISIITEYISIKSMLAFETYIEG